MVKKILAIIFLLIALLIFLSTLMRLPNTITELSSDFKAGNAAYAFGYILGTLIFIVLAIFLIKLSIKWLSNKKKVSNLENQ